MKYAMNHPYKFDAWFKAFIVGFAQMFALVSVELVNVVVLLTNPTVMDTIMNFLALVIISDFDDYFFGTIKGDPIANMVSDGSVCFYKAEEDGEEKEIERSLDDITKIEVTTSQYARFKLPGNLRK